MLNFHSYIFRPSCVFVSRSYMSHSINAIHVSHWFHWSYLAFQSDKAFRIFCPIIGIFYHVSCFIFHRLIAWAPRDHNTLSFINISHVWNASVFSSPSLCHVECRYIKLYFYSVAIFLYDKIRILFHFI